MHANNRLRSTVVSLVALALGAVAGNARAAAQVVASPGATLLDGADLTLSGQLASNGSSSAGVLANGADPTLTSSTPSTYFYKDNFTGPTVGHTALIGSSTGSGFHDAFAFTVTDSAASSITATLGLGDLKNITDLNVRLYSVTPGVSTTPMLGDPLGVWFAAATTGNVATLGTVNLAAGSYVLEVRGLVTGTNGGGYTGELNVAPVPLPAALPLVLSGFGALGAFGVRRRRRP